MPDADLMGLLALGLGLGLLHALDADHILAVSSLSVASNRARPAWQFCTRWALGHGAVLLGAGSLAFLVGRGLPPAWSDYAEGAVGLVLMLLGAWVLIELRRRRIHCHFHCHDGLPAHAHWHMHASEAAHPRADHRHGHGATLLGALHGLAGSAPLLALVPLARHDTGWPAVLYLLVLSFGVLFGMLAFGGALGGALAWLERRGLRWLQRLQAATAMAAMAVGAHLLLGAA